MEPGLNVEAGYPGGGCPEKLLPDALSSRRTADVEIIHPGSPDGIAGPSHADESNGVALVFGKNDPLPCSGSNKL
jgi:hypothetical protein